MRSFLAALCALALTACFDPNDKLLDGSRASGQTCEEIEDCQPGLTCVNRVCQGTASGGSDTGGDTDTPQDTATTQASCANTNSACDGSNCCVSTDTCALDPASSTTVCFKACETSTDCATGCCGGLPSGGNGCVPEGSSFFFCI